MSAKIAAQGLIMAALGLVGDYSAAPMSAIQSAPIERAVAQHKLTSIKRVLRELITGWTEVDEVYARAIRTTLKRDSFDNDYFSELPEYISQIRGLETALKSAAAPEEVAAEHIALRRAVASARSRIVELNSLISQAKGSPSYVKSQINTDGLKALARHTDRELRQLA